MKALERPQQWHLRRMESFKDKKIACYCVMLFHVYSGDDPEMDGDFQEEEKYFPATKAGLAAAKAADAANGRGFYYTEIEARYILPHKIKMNSPAFKSWCKAWNVSF
jgi:hypothetical protein